VDEKDKLYEKVNENIEVFKLEDLYNEAHRDVVAELIAKKRLHPGNYIESVSTLFGKHKLPQQEVYRLALGNYCADRELGKRPLSKLTKDIALELGLIDKDFIK